VRAAGNLLIGGAILRRIGSGGFPGSGGASPLARRARKGVLLLPVVLVALALVLATDSPTRTAGKPPVGPTPRAGKPTACSQFGSFSVGHWPPGCWRPYGERSPFNTPIPANPQLASDATAIAHYMQSHHWVFEGDHGNFTIDDGGSRPVYWSQRSDPLVKVTCRGGFSCRRGLRIHIPAGAQPQGASDGHMTVVDQQSGREYDFWQASTPANGRMTVSAASSIPIGAGRGTGLAGAAEAADLGLLGGLIRAPELAAGKIEHALAISVECVQRSDVWPAPTWARGDSVCPGGGGPHFSSLLQLNMSDAEINESRAPAWQRTIMTAMAHYGVYVVDSNGVNNREMGLIQESEQSFTSFGYPGAMNSYIRSAGGNGQLAGVPIDVSRLRVIAPCVPRRTC
jgi:hypothetical protein